MFSETGVLGRVHVLIEGARRKRRSRARRSTFWARWVHYLGGKKSRAEARRKVHVSGDSHAIKTCSRHAAPTPEAIAWLKARDWAYQCDQSLIMASGYRGLSTQVLTFSCRGARRPMDEELDWQGCYFRQTARWRVLEIANGVVYDPDFELELARQGSLVVAYATSAWRRGAGRRGARDVRSRGPPFGSPSRTAAAGRDRVDAHRDYAPTTHTPATRVQRTTAPQQPGAASFVAVVNEGSRCARASPTTSRAADATSRLREATEAAKRARPGTPAATRPRRRSVARWDCRSAQASEPARTRKVTRPHRQTPRPRHTAPAGSGANATRRAAGASPGGAKSFESTSSSFVETAGPAAPHYVTSPQQERRRAGRRRAPTADLRGHARLPMQPPLTSCTSMSVEGPTGRAKATSASGRSAPAIAGRRRRPRGDELPQQRTVS